MHLSSDGRRKRGRAEECSAANSVLLVSGNYKHVFQLPDIVKEHVCVGGSSRYSGLRFFYHTYLSGTENGIPVISLSPNDESLERKTERKGIFASCPQHGPFPCSCHALHAAIDHMRLLLEEIGCAGWIVDVAVDRPAHHPHIAIHSAERVWYCVLTGLPLPNRRIGPFALVQLDDPRSFVAHCRAYRLAKESASNGCSHCGKATSQNCRGCWYLLCPDCACECDGCHAPTCSACRVCDFEGGDVYCRECFYDTTGM